MDILLYRYSMFGWVSTGLLQYAPSSPFSISKIRQTRGADMCPRSRESSASLFGVSEAGSRAVEYRPMDALVPHRDSRLSLCRQGDASYSQERTRA